MLKRLNGEDDMTGAEVAIRDADFPVPFASGLEYNAPARGPWNIVHTGMLMPESHQVFACAQGCLRGVILTAAEMEAMDRMSWISVDRNDLFDGSLERNIVDGTADILRKLPRKPRAILLFLSCVHLFAGCDFEAILAELRAMFPDVVFVDCYMNPTMRKSGLTPDQLMRRQLYAPLAPCPSEPKTANLIGNDRPTDESSELARLVREAGWQLRDVTDCKTFDKYLAMAKSALEITYLPTAAAAGDALERRLGRKHLYLPLSYDFDEIERNLAKLADALGIDAPDWTGAKRNALRALEHAREIAGDFSVEIDYTATPRPVGLALLLAEHGFRVTRVYTDAMIEEERPAFERLRSLAPDLLLTATVHAKMRFAGKGVHEHGPVLAIGQKAAYFSGTRHFVNIVSGGGMYGFDGVAKLAALIEDAAIHEKDTETVIQHKGLGCRSCL
ncbi:MAG: nitrogenase component 1 [Lentisphaeria bacterium]|nr:nitrogenase component 1 [Lentisphaeria bacterium]